ncbi:MAG: demethoxyubiquinone hydroxylase family protein, partial [Pseudomonadales bacterium]
FIAELRSNHAGETGAVFIYKGVLAATSNPDLRTFATDHLAVEVRHLEFFENWMPHSQHSKLIGIWKVAGFALGAFSAFLGSRTLFATIDAVETFVVKHYQQQLDYLNTSGNSAEQALTPILRKFQLDEAEHQSDASKRLLHTGAFATLWQRIVGSGSAMAVNVARKI